MSKQTMQQLTEHFKFSSRHGDVKASFSRRPILRRPRPSGLDLCRIGAEDENIMLIRFYRNKFTLAFNMKKFFISSTFHDMHRERDMMQNIVRPAVNQKLNEHGGYVSFCDLRWGIDTTTDSTERRILDSCFDEIISCKPYFIVFIGGRYGWIPSYDLLIPYKDKFGDVDILGKSVTELEILYALKENGNKLDRCLFYIKDDAEFENEDTKKRIEELIHKIEHIASSQIRHYTLKNKDAEYALSNQLIKDICTIVSIDKPLSWQDRITNQMKVKCKTALPGITSPWLEGLKNESIDLAILLFPECRIKEAFIVNFSTQIKCKRRKDFLNKLFRRGCKEANVIYINAGATKYISNTYELQKYLIFKICEACKIDVPPIENLSEVKLRILISNILIDYAKSGDELYIIISEYDKLVDAQNIKWLPDPIRNIKWVVSLSDESIAESFPSTPHTKSIYGTSHLGNLSFDKQIAAYENWSGKTIAPQVKGAIKTLPYADDYVMLEILFNRLMHFDGKDIPSGDTKDIPQYMEQYIKNIPCNYEKYGEAVLYLLRGDFEKFNPDLCEFIFICLAFFKRGLMISDIEKLAQLIGLSWTEFDIKTFLNYESFLLIRYEDDRYGISSRVISNILVKLYHQKFKSEYSNIIYNYLNELPVKASLKIDNFWFMSYETNHFAEYLNYLKTLSEVRIDNITDLKAAFLPLFSNTEAIKWMLTSFKKEKIKYDSTDFITKLISIVAQTFSAFNPQLVDKFVAATENIENSSGDLTTIFRQHYTLALVKIMNFDYSGFIEDLNICLELSEKQFKENPPQLKYLDEDVEHNYPITSLDDMLATEYGFSFVEDMAALMSKYTDLPEEYRDEDKAAYYADKASEIRARLSKAFFVNPENLLQKRSVKDVARYRRVSWLRGRAVELSKQSARTENVDLKIKLLKESIEIFDEILAKQEDDLAEGFKDSEKFIESETAMYEECFRDRALTFSYLANIIEDEKFDLLHKAFNDILEYEKKHKNERVKKDIFNIAQRLATISLEKGQDNLCLNCCIKTYEAYAEIKPQTCFIYSDVNIDDYIFRVTIKNQSLQDLWISGCIRMINEFQSLRKFDSMRIITKVLYKSLKRYVLEEKIERHTDILVELMESMSCQFKDIMNQEYFASMCDDASMLLESESIRGNNRLGLLNTMYQYASSLLHKGMFNNALEICKKIDQSCKSINESSPEASDFIFRVNELFMHIYMEQNDLLQAQRYMNGVVSRYEHDFNIDRNLTTLISFANAKLNQVLLWDKLAEDVGLHILLLHGENYNYMAEKQLYDLYMLCNSFKEKSEEKGLLMRRVLQTFNIIKEKSLGQVATLKVLDSVKHIRELVKEAEQEAKEGKHRKCMKKFELVVNTLRNSHWVDIYFKADWYAGILYVLGQDAWKHGRKEACETYYEEALQIRYELDAERISQNKENFALLLYFYALLILNKPISQESLVKVTSVLIKSQELFEDIENQLGTDSLSYYASCCFNLGQIICLYTANGNKDGLPLIALAINIMERLVNNYGLSHYERDLAMFRQRYENFRNAACRIRD